MGATVLARDHPHGIDREHPGIWNIHLVTDGRCRLITPQGPVDLIPDDLVAFGPNAHMCVEAPSESRDPTGWRWIAVADQPRFQSLLHYPAIADGVGRIHLDDDTARRPILRAWEDLEHAYRVHSPPRRLDLILNIVERLLIWADASNPRAHAPHEDPQIANAVLFLRLHFDEHLTVADLAARTDWTPSHFAHRFREITGTTPMRYLEEVRLRNACDLLRDTDLDQSEIANRCGFANAAYFSRVFRKHWRMPPGQWRRQQHG